MSGPPPQTELVNHATRYVSKRRPDFGCPFSGCGNHAWADSADRFQPTAPSATEVPELPAAVPAAVPDIAAEFDALQRDAATAGLKLDWSALKAYYAAHGNNAIWTTANGYTLLGQAWIVQVPRAVRAGMPMQEQTLLKIAGMTPPVDAASQTRNEALMSAMFVASAIDAVGPLGSAKLRGAAVLDKLAAAKDPGAVMGQEWPAYYRFWSLYAKLPAYVGYYQAGGWPSVPEDRQARARPVEQRDPPPSARACNIPASCWPRPAPTRCTIPSSLPRSSSSSAPMASTMTASSADARSRR